MKKISVKTVTVIAAFLFLAPMVTFAAQAKHTTKRPSKAAISACKDKKAGDAVELTAKGKKVAATCQDINGKLVAVPATK